MTTEPYGCLSLVDTPNKKPNLISNLPNLVGYTGTQIQHILAAANDAQFVGAGNGVSNVFPLFPVIDAPILHVYHQATVPHPATPEDIDAIYALYQSLMFLGQLKARSRAEIAENIENTLVIKCNGKLVACVVMITIDNHTIELGGIAVAMSHQNQKFGGGLIDAVENYADAHGKDIISVTGSSLLAHAYEQRGYLLYQQGGSLDWRANMAPMKSLYTRFRDESVSRTLVDNQEPVAIGV